jgi:hypothetical protein
MLTPFNHVLKLKFVENSLIYTAVTLSYSYSFIFNCYNYLLLLS